VDGLFFFLPQRGCDPGLLFYREVPFLFSARETLAVGIHFFRIRFSDPPRRVMVVGVSLFSERFRFPNRSISLAFTPILVLGRASQHLCDGPFREIFVGRFAPHPPLFRGSAPPSRGSRHQTDEGGLSPSPYGSRIGRFPLSPPPPPPPQVQFFFPPPLWDSGKTACSSRFAPLAFLLSPISGF